VRIRLFVEIEAAQQPFLERVLARLVEHKLREVPEVHDVQAIYIPQLLPLDPK
jgi:hypothetical protein